MNRKNAFRLVAGIIFLCFLCLGIFLANAAVRPNEDRDGIWVTYRSLDSNSIDVLCTGSSKIHANVNPLIMWREHGFTSYDISGSSMDLNTMYYYLREAFKTQTPKVVVIDILLMGDKRTSLDDIQKRNIMIMPFGANKFAAAMSENVFPADREKVLFPMEQFHSRVLIPGQVVSTGYLNKTFAQESNNVFMGYRYLGSAMPCELNEQIQKYDDQLFDRHFLELKRSLDFLAAQDCQVLLVNTPSSSPNNLFFYENELEKRIAKSYKNVSYYWPRMYRQPLNLDYATELLDSGHLNNKGAGKFSKLLGNHIDFLFSQELKKSHTTRATANKFQADYNRYYAYSIRQM